MKKALNNEENLTMYGIFIEGNHILSSTTPIEGPEVYRAVSNFSIEIIADLFDEMFPKKVVRIKNVYGTEKVFETASENLNSLSRFEDTMLGFGNFTFTGNKKDLQKLRILLFDTRGAGRKIESLGWQSDLKVWVWNNAVTTENGEIIPIDNNGIFIKDDVSYYCPSANTANEFNVSKTLANKKFDLVESKFSFDEYALKMLQVYKENAITSILFSIASVFQDIIVEHRNNFPILFIHGNRGTGKSAIAQSTQSFIGGGESYSALESITSLKKNLKSFATIKNGIVNLSEYNSGSVAVDNGIKSIYDRRGYKYGFIEGCNGAQNLPVTSSFIVTSNLPAEDAVLYTRFILIEMTKDSFNEKEHEDFYELQQITSMGITGFANNLIKYREYFDKNYYGFEKTWREYFANNSPTPNIPTNKIISNYSVLAATYEMFRNFFNFPFNTKEMIDHFNNSMQQQVEEHFNKH